MLTARYRSDGEAVIKMNEVSSEAKAELLSHLADGTYRTESVPCALCGGVSFTALSEKDRFGLHVDTVACQGCGLVQTNPRMTAASYALFYDDEYRRLMAGREGPTEWFFKHQMDRGTVVFRWLQRRGLLPAAGGTVLEVGCGAGGNLVPFREAGYAVSGVDLGSEYVAYGRDTHGLDLHTGTVADFPGAADLVIYRQVFEHLLDPEEELAELSKHLAPDAVVYIEVPGVKDLNYVNGDFLRYCQIPHVFHFSKTTLELALAIGGFTMLDGDETVRAAFTLAQDAVNEPVPDPREHDVVVHSLHRSEVLRPGRRLARPLLEPAQMVIEALRVEGPVGLQRLMGRARERLR